MALDLEIGRARAGELVTVLDEYAASYDIMAVYPQQRHVPRRCVFHRASEAAWRRRLLTAG
jgi:hypothetical protein